MSLEQGTAITPQELPPHHSQLLRSNNTKPAAGRVVLDVIHRRWSMIGWDAAASRMCFVRFDDVVESVAAATIRIRNTGRGFAAP